MGKIHFLEIRIRKKFLEYVIHKVFLR